MDEINQLLKQGIEAARAGDTEEARDIFEKITELDAEDERAWLWLATISKNNKEKRTYLDRVLSINPDNERAQKLLQRIKSDAKQDEIIPGLTRQRLLFVGGGTLAIYVLVMILLFSVGAGRRSSFYGAQTQTSNDLIARQTGVQNTSVAISMAETQAVETRLAEQSPTPTATATRLNELPPTWTPVPDVQIDTSAGAVVTPLASLPIEQIGNGSIIVGYGGQERLQNGFLPLIGMPLDQPGTILEIGSTGGDSSKLVNSVDINPANGQEIVYTRFYTTDFNYALERSSVNGSQSQRFADAWQGIEFLIRQEEAQFSYDGSKVVFIGQSEDTLSREIWILDLEFTPGISPLRRVTNDSSDYFLPTISPDGTQVVAIKMNEQLITPAEDLVLIEVSSGRQTALTNDGASFIEAYPRWLPSGEEVAYVAHPDSIDNPGDIIKISIVNRTAPPQYIVRDGNGWDDSHPIFSPDGNYMAYASDRTGVFNVFVQDLRTTITFQVTNDAFYPHYPGGWYQPDVMPVREPVVPLPTPFLTATPQ